MLLKQYSNHRFTLTPGRWYAAEFIGAEFGNSIRSCSPIRIDAVKPKKAGQRQFILQFYHGNYPEGVRDKEYTLTTIERSLTFLLARSLDHDPARLLLVYEISWKWLTQYGDLERPEGDDIQQYLEAAYR